MPTDRIAELRTLRQQWLDGPINTGDRYTAMRLYETALVNAGPDLFDCADACTLAAKINPYGSVENARARDAAQAALARLNGNDNATSEPVGERNDA